MADQAITTGVGMAGMGGIPIAPEYQARLEEAQARKAQQASQGSGYNPFTLYKEKDVCYSPGKWAFRRLIEDTVGNPESFDKTAKFFAGAKYTPEIDGSKSANYRKMLTDNDWLKNQHGQFVEWTGKQSYFEKLYASNPHEGINNAFKQTFKNWDEKTPITTGDLKAATDTGHLSLDGIKTAAQSASALSYDELFGMHDAEKARIQAVVREEGKVAGLKQIFSKDRWQYGKEVLSGKDNTASTVVQRAKAFTKKVLWNNEVKWATEPASKGQWFGAVLRPLAVGLAAWDVLSTTARAFSVSRQKGDGFFTSCAKALGTFIVKSVKTAFLWSLGTAAAWAVGAALSVFALPAIAATVLTVLGAAAITYGAHRLMNCVVPDPPCIA
ncbi:MAG: hypothetical protein QE263_03450 [Vampirovibrionales bacterium]|nr:hypothetical protein [Vampirovibrionales bacterium]